MNRRTGNLQIFEDSLELMKENSRLKEAIEESVNKQILYLEEDKIEIPKDKGLNCKTVVSGKRSFEAAADYAKAGRKVAVLNFASATNPGGGVTRGSTAQEECLCRVSTLYPCLDIDMMWKNFYKPHRKAENPLYNDDCLYTPGVIVFKSDTAYPERMEEKDWYQVDVITSAAPNLRNISGLIMKSSAGKDNSAKEEDRLYELHSQRIEKVFRVAAANGAEVLILGAFGCGAFFNPPKVVARAFKTVQEKYESYFETIEYAVYCSSYETKNYDVFCEMLS